MPEERTKVIVFDKYLQNSTYHRNITVASFGKFYCFSCKKRCVIDKDTNSYFFENDLCTDHDKIVWTCSFTNINVNPSHWMPFIPTPHPIHDSKKSHDCCQECVR